MADKRRKIERLRITSIDDELIHSDSHDIQRQLALEVDRPRRIQERLSTSIR